MTQHPQALRLPFTLFQTQNRMEDYSADDMRCGDLSELQLRKNLRLEKVSGMYDPWRAERTDLPISNYAVIRHKMSHQAVAKKLFDEFRRDSLPFSFLGHRGLFTALVDHFQYGEGKPFASSELNGAYRRLIEEKNEEGSLYKINETLTDILSKNAGFYPEQKKSVLRDAVRNSFLPRFNRWKDSVNGLGMSVHDIYATKVTLKSLEVDRGNYRAVLHYKGQDHFGLDDRDIRDPRFHHLNIFRIWFVLQRWEKYACQPFLTNMEATITLTGSHT
ncbi:DUF3289 family protein [Erwinia sp. CGal63]|uniref:DUF3289 family protein n=1 Tax=Erwinia sp. CGal63 TaxID=2919889 RepID=UPI003009E104